MMSSSTGVSEFCGGRPARGNDTEEIHAHEAPGTDYLGVLFARRRRHGSDRTGTMCALYRIAVQGWSKEDAIREMTAGGFGFHRIMRP